MSTYYDTLEISKDATPDIIKKAYKQLVLKYHPDKNKTASENIIKQINEAYNILIDPEKRKQYDSSLFGAVMTVNMNHNLNIPIIIVNISLTLEEIYKGVTKQIKYNRQVIKKNKYNNINVCSACNGTGSITKSIQLPGYSMTQTSTCGSCYGKSVETITEEAVYNVEIAPGLLQNIFKNIGNEHIHNNNIVIGDIQIIINTIDHKIFKRVNDYDLVYTMNITFVDSICGASKIITDIAGDEIWIKYDGNITNTTKLIVSNHGLKYNNKRGNLIILFEIEKTYISENIKNQIYKLLTDKDINNRDDDKNINKLVDYIVD